MESRNKLTMCRLCLCENECFINIYEMNDWQGYVAAEVISDLLQFKVSETDCYPHVVCSTCLVKLTDFKVFKECCQNSKVTYEKMFVSSKSLVKHQPEMVELVTVKTEPIHYSDNEDNVSKTSSGHVGSEDESQEKGPIERSNNPDVTDLNEFEEGPMEEEEGQRSAAEHGVGGRKDKFQCHHCKKVLTTKYGLRSHLASHGIGKCFKCNVCGKTFGRNRSLVSHARIHTGEKPFICEVCSKRFTECSHLKVHMRLHIGLKPYCCKECNISFVHHCSFKKHMKIHADLKPFSCKVCHAEFSDMSTLTGHMEIHDVDKMFKCDVCSKKFPSHSKLERHMIVHTLDMPYRCIYCSKQFKWKVSLSRHLKTVCAGKC